MQASHARQLSNIKKTAEQELKKELADLTPLGVEAKLRAKLEAQQQLINMLNGDSSISAMVCACIPNLYSAALFRVTWLLKNVSMWAEDLHKSKQTREIPASGQQGLRHNVRCLT